MKKVLRVLITAGPTIEPIDPVRFISNRSTGYMGYELAREAAKRGFRTTLISGPVSIAAPGKARLIRIERALELKKKVHEELKRNDVLIMSSAVSDFRPTFLSKHKIKSKPFLSLNLRKNPDILGSIPRSLRKNKIIVGFSLETENLVENSLKKLKSKRLDMVIANQVTKRSVPFGVGPKKVYLIEKSGFKKILKKHPKSRVASAILDRVEELCYTPN